MGESEKSSKKPTQNIETGQFPERQESKKPTIGLKKGKSSKAPTRRFDTGQFPELMDNARRSQSPDEDVLTLAPPTDDVDATQPPQATAIPKNLREKIAAISIEDALALARTGDMRERAAIQQRFGNVVGEELLCNPEITIPEVANVARDASEQALQRVVSNDRWMSSPAVRRALLGNERMNADTIFQTLEVMPKSELQRVVKHAAYSEAVRAAARALLA